MAMEQLLRIQSGDVRPTPQQKKHPVQRTGATASEFCYYFKIVLFLIFKHK